MYVVVVVVVQRPTWRGRRREQQQQTLHRLNQLERKCVFSSSSPALVHVWDLWNDMYNVTCNSSLYTAQEERKSVVWNRREGRGGLERNKKKMDGLSNVYWKTLVGLIRVDVAFRRDGTARVVKEIVVSPSHFLLLLFLLPLRTFPTVTKWGWTSPQLKRKKLYDTSRNQPEI